MKQKSVIILIITLVITNDCFTQINFRCGESLPLTGCNYIINPEFAITDPTHLLAAFTDGNVPGWGGVSCATPDINGYGNPYYMPPPLPASIAGVNCAGMLTINSYPPPYIPDSYFEPISTKIVPLQKGRSYAFSFFLSSINIGGWLGVGGSTFTFKAVLTKCYNISPVPCSYPYNPASPPWMPALNEKQDIFCETIQEMPSSDWKQYSIRFTADDDYDMLVIYPDITNLYPSGTSYLHFAYPELIDATPPIIATEKSPCDITLSACGVTNAAYYWTDPLGNYAGDTREISVNPAAAGDYSVQITLPGEATSNNTCSENNPTLEAQIKVSSSCECGSLQIHQASAGFYQGPPGGTWHTQALDVCANNILCDNGNELIQLTLSSNEPTGNHWEFFSSNPNLIGVGFNYYVGDEYSQDIDGYFVVAPYETGVIEVRLTNTLLNEVKSFFIKVVSHEDAHQGGCDSWRARQAMVTDTAKNKKQAEPPSVKGSNQSLVYPNPVTSVIHVLATKDLAQLDLLSIQGRSIRSVKTTGNRAEVSIVTLQKGTYLLVMKYKDGTYENKLIIKQ